MLSMKSLWGFGDGQGCMSPASNAEIAKRPLLQPATSAPHDSRVKATHLSLHFDLGNLVHCFLEDLPAAFVF